MTILTESLNSVSSANLKFNNVYAGFLSTEGLVEQSIGVEWNAVRFIKYTELASYKEKKV